MQFCNFRWKFGADKITVEHSWKTECTVAPRQRDTDPVDLDFSDFFTIRQREVCNPFLQGSSNKASGAEVEIIRYQVRILM